MSTAKIELSQTQLLIGLDTLKKEVFALESQITDLEQQNAQSPMLLQILRKWLVFGPIKKLEWIRFRLKLKTEELLVSNTHYNKFKKIFKD